MRPSTYHFPQRNRIVAGLAKATIIVEATIKSGSLITAKFAADYNREVFAVPGFPMDINFSGNNYLIKNGAHLLDNPQEIFDVIKFSQIKPVKKKFTEVKIDQEIDYEAKETKKEVFSISDKILEKLDSSPVDVDDLLNALNIPPSLMQATILKLELSGEIKRVGNNSIAKSSFNEFVANFEA